MVERSGVDSSKATLVGLEEQQRSIREQVKAAEQVYLVSVMGELGGTSKSRLFRQGPSILEFATTEGINPEWLFGILSKATVDVNDHHYPILPTPPPTSSDHRDYYTYAMQTIAGEAYSRNMYRHLARQLLERAEQLAQKEEVNTADPEIKMSVAYRWMYQHLDTLYEIHKEEWWVHY